MRSDNNTKTKILDSAEKLFAIKGFAGTSIRTIVHEADVNIAAIHYHFGSKEALLEAVLQRRLAPVNEERLSLLDRHQAAHPSGPLPLEGVIEAFVAPMVRMRFNPLHDGDLFPRLLGRSRIEGDQHILATVHSVLEPVIERFTAAFAHALPHLVREELLWRMHCMIGVISFTMIIPKDGDAMTNDAIDLNDPEALIRRLTAFTAAGMRGAEARPAGRENE